MNRSGGELSTQSAAFITDNYCEFCCANLNLITPWNQPHLCKEITYQSMPIIEFVPFNVSSV